MVEEKKVASGAQIAECLRDIIFQELNSVTKVQIEQNVEEDFFYQMKYGSSNVPNFGDKMRAFEMENGQIVEIYYRKEREKLYDYPNSQVYKIMFIKIDNRYNYLFGNRACMNNILFVKAR